MSANLKLSLVLHFTNVKGTGAIQLLKSLLPAIEQNNQINVSTMHIPDSGALALYQSLNPTVKVLKYNRLLPNFISRIIECFLWDWIEDDLTPILVLGDLPLRTKANQTVFVQNSHLLKPAKVRFELNYFKYVVSRLIFKKNLKYVNNIIVQTEVVKLGLLQTYGDIKANIYVIPQPVPQWLLNSRVNRTSRVEHDSELLNLFYPAAFYPHKNHQLLSEIATEKKIWPIKKLTLTIEPIPELFSNIKWIDCIGLIEPEQVLQKYSEVDALLFLSKEESFGFPLIEAMYLGLPIVCPDLPYARILCGDEAIYFEPNSVSSLHRAVYILKEKLDNGWWPKWHDQLRLLPNDWSEVAELMATITISVEKVVK